MRVILIGALCACGLGAGAVRAAAAATTRTAVVPSPIPAMSRALASATRYRLVVSSGALAGEPALQTTAIVVGRGTATRIYAIVVATAKGKTIHGEEYVAGSKVCRRLGTTGRFSCATSSSDAATMAQGFDPARLLVRPGVAVTFTPIAARTVAGQRCDGYNVVSRFTTSETSRGLFYVAHGSHLPCALDGTLRVTTSETDRSGKRTKVQTATLSMVWSRFDDSSLTIPPIATS